MRNKDIELIQEFGKLGYKCEWYGMGKEYDWEHHREVPCATYTKGDETIDFSILIYELSDEYRKEHPARFLDCYRITSKGLVGIEEKDGELFTLYKRQISRLLEMQRNYKNI